MKKVTVLFFVLMIAVSPLLAKDKPPETAMELLWPAESPAPILRFRFTKLQSVGSFQGQNSYNTNVTVESLWSKKIERAQFSLYLFDANHVRVGEGWISISNLGPKEATKFSLNISSLGTPVSMKLEPRELGPELAVYGPAKKINTTVYTVPAGATISVDGKALGSTPLNIELTVGKHDLQFAKEGYNTGHFPMVVAPNDVSGGSISYELGGLSYDTVELRDGSSLTGDVISVDPNTVTVRVAGEIKAYDRNRVKRILLIERQPTAAQPASSLTQ